MTTCRLKENVLRSETEAINQNNALFVTKETQEEMTGYKARRHRDDKKNGDEKWFGVAESNSKSAQIFDSIVFITNWLWVKFPKKRQIYRQDVLVFYPFQIVGLFLLIMWLFAFPFSFN